MFQIEDNLNLYLDFIHNTTFIMSESFLFGYEGSLFYTIMVLW